MAPKLRVEDQYEEKIKATHT